jgi:DNA-binding response OmpR family regulator
MRNLVLMNSKIISEIVSKALNTYGYQSEIIKVLPKRISRNIELLIIETGLVINNTELQKTLMQLKINSPELFVVGISINQKWEDKIEFLTKYGEDVLSYPFPLQELLARIQLLFKKSQSNIKTDLKVGDVRINTIQRKVFNKNEEIPLCKKEYVLIEYMARNKNRPISRSELLDHIWDYKRINNSNTVDVHINRLRRKIVKKDAIKTVYGFGYRFDE